MGPKSDELEAASMNVDFSDPEDFVDDITDEELMPDLFRQKPSETNAVDGVIVVDGIPTVGTERLERLKGVIRKIYQKVGKIVTEHYPVTETGETKGYIFLEFATHRDAAEAVKHTEGYKLDKSHTFSVNLFTDFLKYEQISDDWEMPKEESYSSTVSSLP